MGYINTSAQTYYGDSSAFGNYQFVSLNDIIEYFMFVYVGEDKIISKASRTDVAFHAQRGLAELSFDTFKSCKAEEITVPASLQMILPQDYVNYTKISWVDSAGIKHPLYPTSDTSNPTRYQTDSNDKYIFDANGDLIVSGDLIRNGSFDGGLIASIPGNANFLTFPNIYTPLPASGIYPASAIIQTPISLWMGDPFPYIGFEPHYFDWILNRRYPSGADGILDDTSWAGISVGDAGAANAGDPVEGWFYGSDGNAIKAYSVSNSTNRGQVVQHGVPIQAGESYEVKFTVSGYVSGVFQITIVDQNGDIARTTAVNANGTYTETLVAGGTSANHYPSMVV